MHSPFAIYTLIKQAESGNIAAIGNTEVADEVLGFAFDVIYTDQGRSIEPAGVDSALADFITNDEVLRSKNMTLQEEIAKGVVSRDKTLRNQIEVMHPLKAPYRHYDTYELLTRAKKGIVARQAGTLAVVAFRHHLPRAAAIVRKAGFDVTTPDVCTVGDFDSNSDLPWTRNKEAWIRRERLAIPYFAAKGRI